MLLKKMFPLGKIEFTVSICFCTVVPGVKDK